MFTPNLDCLIFQSDGGTTVYGQPMPNVAAPIPERCAIPKMSELMQKSAVRADSSASRGAALELTVDAILLLTKNTQAQIDDVIEVIDLQLRIIGKYPRFDVTGRLDHYQVAARFWSE